VKALGYRSASEHLKIQESLYLNECVVQNKHNSREIPRDWRIEKEHLSDIADIPSFRMSETEFPNWILEGAKESAVPANIPNNK
jgi:hypothetical protein